MHTSEREGDTTMAPTLCSHSAIDSSNLSMTSALLGRESGAAFAAAIKSLMRHRGCCLRMATDSRSCLHSCCSAKAYSSGTIDACWLLRSSRDVRTMACINSRTPACVALEISASFVVTSTPAVEAASSVLSGRLTKRAKPELVVRTI